MVQCLYKILYIVISFSFFISATEIDLGESHNTFFDEYDTYIKTEQVSIDHDVTLQQQHNDYAFIYYIIIHYKSLNSQAKTDKHPQLAYYHRYPPKLFLRNSVWRI